MNPIERYLSLLKKSLLDELYIDNEARLVYLMLCILNDEIPDGEVVRQINQHRPDIVQRLRAARSGAGGEAVTWHVAKAGGVLNLRNLLELSHTMIGQASLDNLQACLQSIVSENIPGDVIETGVWRGGATIFMRGFLAAHNITDRRVWVADSFQGVPKPTLPQDAGWDLSADLLPILAVPRAEVEELFARYDLLDEQVCFLEGWFRDTLPAAPIQRLALMRLDGDLYESTRDALVPLYPKLSIGGFVIIDDYHDISACRHAVDEYRAAHGITDPIQPINPSAVFWRKTK